MKVTEKRYCAWFLPFSHLILVLSSSFSCDRHYCTASPPPPHRMWCLASQQIMWRTRVLAEEEAMSHKGPRWVLDYDNIRKCKKEEVSAGSWQACEDLGEIRTYLSEKPGCQLDSNMMIAVNWWHRRFHWQSSHYCIWHNVFSSHVPLFFSLLQNITFLYSSLTKQWHRKVSRFNAGEYSVLRSLLSEEAAQNKC